MFAAKLMGKSNGDSQRFAYGNELSDTGTKETIIQIKRWIGELNALLKEYAGA
jgi:hypothetical protein